MDELSRRRFVAGGTVVAISGLAGCAGDGEDGDGNTGGDGTPTPTPTGTETPTETEDGGEWTENEQKVVDFLTSDPATDNFEDTFDDLGDDEPTIAVGAEGNGGNLAFDPPAARVSVGTTVTWEWTGEGGAHNVSSTDDSDFEFRSGDPVDSADETYEETFDEPGAALYVCEPHESIGMKGGIVVEEG